MGHADGVVVSNSHDEVFRVVSIANRRNIPVTVGAGRTSITGASVPQGGIVLDVRGLNRIRNDDVRIVEPGVNLSEYKSLVESKGLFYPPDPTSERNCALGGNIACNVSGALSYLYGPTRDYIQGLSLVLPCGHTLTLERGQVLAERGFFRVPENLLTPGIAEGLNIPLPESASRSWRYCKSAAGLSFPDPKDLIDLFIGSEGLFGIITGVKTKLLPSRRSFFALQLYTPTRERTVEIVRSLDLLRRLFSDGDDEAYAPLLEGLRPYGGERRLNINDFNLVTPACMEWVGASVAPLLGPARAEKLARYYGSVYIEQEYSGDMEDCLSQWFHFLDLINQKGEPVETEVALDSSGIRKWKEERRRIPEKLNESIASGLVKVGTDFAVPMHNLANFLALHDDLPGGKSYVFGHIGNAHLHANILPDNESELAQFREMTLVMAEKVLGMDGTVSGEHGIGKLKKKALRMMLGERGVEEIAAIKRIMDPNGILNVGNMI